jgi:hypothetical protein
MEMRLEILEHAMVRAVVVALALGLGLLARPRTVEAQQSASVLVRVNVISVPLAPAAFDSLSLTMRDSVSAGTRARVIARAGERGLRVAFAEPDAPSRSSTPPTAAPRDRNVLLMEYVAN